MHWSEMKGLFKKVAIGPAPDANIQVCTRTHAERVGSPRSGFHIALAHVDSANSIISKHTGYFGTEYNSIPETN